MVRLTLDGTAVAAADRPTRSRRSRGDGHRLGRGRPRIQTKSGERSAVMRRHRPGGPRSEGARPAGHAHDAAGGHRHEQPRGAREHRRPAIRMDRQDVQSPLRMTASRARTPDRTAATSRGRRSTRLPRKSSCRRQLPGQKNSGSSADVIMTKHGAARAARQRRLLPSRRRVELEHVGTRGAIAPRARRAAASRRSTSTTTRRTRSAGPSSCREPISTRNATSCSSSGRTTCCRGRDPGNLSQVNMPTALERAETFHRPSTVRTGWCGSEIFRPSSPRLFVQRDLWRRSTACFHRQHHSS